MEETSYSSRQKQADGTQHSDQLPLMQILLFILCLVRQYRIEYLTARFRMSEARAAPNSYGFLFMFPYPRAKVPSG